MKKTKMIKVFCPKDRIKKYLMIMKLVSFLLLMGVMQLSAKVYSQKGIVRFDKNTMTVEQVFDNISRQLDYDIFYSEDKLEVKKEITFNKAEMEVKEVLDKVLESKFNYEFIDKTIIIIPKKNEASDGGKKVSGTVKDKDGNPLLGVTVMIKGTTVGVATDINGKFEILISKTGDILVFSCIGMETKEIKVSDKKEYTVVLQEIVSQMEEVVVTGYQKIQRNKLTSSISTVDMDKLKTVNQPSIDKLLQGQVPGMTIMSSSGAPGAVPQIRIRGTSTLSGTAQPLWVIDGVILDDPVNATVDDILTNRNLIASGIGGINVEDIESINVLKDAAATAIYGTRAANGVIVITSKRGNAGRTRINFSSSMTLSERPYIKDGYMMNSKERLDVNREMIEKNVFKASSSKAGEYGTASDFERYFIDVHDHKMSWADFDRKVRELETVNTDWFDEVFRNSLSQRYSLSISGGNEKTTFYISGSYNDEQSVAKDVSMQTYTGTVKVSTKLKDNLRVDAKMDISARENHSFFAADSRENPFEWAINTTRAHRIYDENGEYNHLYYNDTKYNYLENRDECWRDSRNFNIRGQVDLEWRLLKDLTFSSLFSFSKQNTTEEDIATEDSFFVRERRENVYELDGYTAVYIWKDGGYFKGKNTNNNSITFRNQLQYMPVINHEHRFDVLLGQEIRKTKYIGTEDEIYGYVHDRGRQQMPQWELIKSLGRPYWHYNTNTTAAVSFFGAFGYTYKNRYTVSLNGRVDGSNRFGVKTNDLFQPLWSAGFNYQIKEEPFLKNVEWLDYLTVKGSYGSQGNVASQAYSDIVTRIGVMDDVNPKGYLQVSAPKNPTLKWEKTESINLAIEFGLWKRHLYGSLEFYNKKAVDLLGSKAVSDVSGFRSVQVNWASMRNRGVEFSFTSINMDLKDFRWTTRFNVGYNENEVLDVYANPRVMDLTNSYKTNYASSAVVGKPINGLWSYRYAGLNEDGRATFYTANKDEKVLQGMKDVDGLVYSGTTMPPYQAGLTNTFNYKKFTLSALLVGSFGNVVRLRQLTTGVSMGFPGATQNMSKEFVNRWRNPGDEKFTDIPVLESDPYNYEVFGRAPYNGNMYNSSDLRTVKGDFVRFQNLSLSYDFYTEKMREKGIQNIRFMLQANNLHVWKNSKLKGQDPEATGSRMRYSNTNSANVSFGNTYLPLSRSYSFSLTVQF